MTAACGGGSRCWPCDRYRSQWRRRCGKVLGALVGEEGLRPVDLDDLACAGDQGAQVVRPRDGEHRVRGAPDQQGRRREGAQLGAGGLVRAYGQVVAETIDLVGVVERRPVVTVTVLADHARAGRLSRDLHASPYALAGSRYGREAEIDVVVVEVVGAII